ncbi:Calcineurin-like phosphoesterase [Colwellia chukchiensis]|uniref:Calcineurin-like phosphoesterase n=1 Tax=Colwellia chukchiensis TaxID=641665 RepID=A0A1H7IRV0_9GAMM|nr:metallophosphoesterase [Colwellia chukchiensis]SEK64437.1 Calcineurin-like phosphoesterase [Colwellia chukchiensis]
MLFNKNSVTLVTLFVLLACAAAANAVTLTVASKSIKAQQQPLSVLAADSQPIQALVSDLNDGPFVFKDNDKLTALWVCNGEKVTQYFDPQTLPLVLAYCQEPVTLDRSHFLEQTVLEYQGDFSVAASSDFHGQYQLMLRLLKNNNIVDQQGHWSFGNGHFVITGDVFDRGDKVTEILWFLYRLEQEAEQAGGKLHLLLGNHEVMVLNGDLRYVHDKYLHVSKRLNIAYQQLYGKGTVLGDWLRTKAVLVKINNMLFTHGGFHPSLVTEQRSLQAINQVFKANLVKAELTTPRSGWSEYLHKRNGPIWYRGYFKGSESDKGASAAEIALLLKHFDVEHLVVGHTSQSQVTTRYQGKVIAIDSSIKHGQYGELLLVKGRQKWRGSLSGKPLVLE